MIRSFANKQTKNVFLGIREKTVPDHLVTRARAKLDRINYTKDLRDLNTPSGNRLERLEGVREDRYSIRVSRAWRICFTWKNGDAFEVELNNHYE